MFFLSSACGVHALTKSSTKGLGADRVGMGGGMGSSDGADTVMAHTQCVL